MQVISASQLKEGDTTIAISHSGSSKDIVDALKISQEHGASTIAITNCGKSPILKHADIKNGALHFNRFIADTYKRKHRLYSTKRICTCNLGIVRCYHIDFCCALADIGKKGCIYDARCILNARRACTDAFGQLLFQRNNHIDSVAGYRSAAYRRAYNYKCALKNNGFLSDNRNPPDCRKSLF